MTPLAVLVGIVMGSAVTITLGLALVLCVFLLMGQEYPALGREDGPLLQSFFLFLTLAFVSSYAFMGILRLRPWRFWAVTVVLLNVAALAWHYWPR